MAWPSVVVGRVGEVGLSRNLQILRAVRGIILDHNLVITGDPLGGEFPGGIIFLPAGFVVRRNVCR